MMLRRFIAFLAQAIACQALFAAQGPDDAILQQLKEMKALVLAKDHVFLTGDCVVTAKDLKLLSGMTALRRLEFNGPKVADGALAELPSLRQVVKLDLGSSGVDGDMKYVAQMKQLKSLSLMFARISGKGIKELAPLSGLEELLLNAVHLSDADMKEIAKFKNLRVLNLNTVPISGDGLKALAGLAEMEDLNLAGIPLTDDDLKTLAPMKKLRKLSLSSQLTDAGIKNLLAVEGLEELRLQRLKITDAAFADLARFGKLRRLEIYDIPLEGNGIGVLAKAAKLESLCLAGTKFAKANLDELTKLRNLRDFSYYGDSLTRADFAKLKAALPQCRVYP
jgi:internalin A